MILKAVLVFFTALGMACAQTAPNDVAEASPSNEKQAVETTTKNETNENECRICDYDFETYKGELNKEEVDGLLLALNDEYLATATYRGVNEKFDDPRPFVNIVRAEEQHSALLVDLFKKYELTVPENPWNGIAPAFESVKAACEAGIQAEIVNRDLYERLLKSTKREDILLVYKNLQRASGENHKPAFERCSSGDGGGVGRGRGRNS